MSAGALKSDLYAARCALEAATAHLAQGLPNSAARDLEAATVALADLDGRVGDLMAADPWPVASS